MKIKTITVLLVAGLVVLAAMVVFAGTAAAEEDPYRITISGYINDTSGNGIPNVKVEITKELGRNNSGRWESVGVNTTDGNGYYNITSRRWYYPLRGDGFVWGNYRMYLDDQMVEEKYIPMCWPLKSKGDCWTLESEIRKIWKRHWSHQWNYEIPEFATIAIPAVAILGLFLFYSHRKRKEE